jgi:ATP-dependent Zn protease
MVCNYAFIEDLGLSTFNTNNPMTMMKIQRYVDKLLKDCYDDTIKMIVDNKERIRAFADILKEREEMTGEEVNEILYAEEQQEI